MEQTQIKIGIDPGVHTGIAIKEIKTNKYILISTNLHKAFDMIKDYINNKSFEITQIVIEDARLWKYHKNIDQNGQKSRSKLQGAGSVKRDCKAWEQFIRDYKLGKITVFVRPDKKRNAFASKDKIKYFEEITGYKGKSSEHSRVAALLVI